MDLLQEEKLVRKKLQAKYQLVETRKDGTKFTNKPLREAAERLQNLAGRYDDMQKQLVEQVCTLVVLEACPYSMTWKQNSSCLICKVGT